VTTEAILTRHYKKVGFVSLVYQASREMRENASIKLNLQWVPSLDNERIICLIPYLYKYVLPEEFSGFSSLNGSFANLALDDNPLLGECCGVEVYTLSPDDKVHFVDKRGEYPSVSFNVRGNNNE